MIPLSRKSLTQILLKDLRAPEPEMSPWSVCHKQCCRLRLCCNRPRPGSYSYRLHLAGGRYLNSLRVKVTTSVFPGYQSIHGMSHVLHALGQAGFEKVGSVHAPM